MVLTVVLVAAVRLLTIPRGFWEGEELRLARSLLTFDPLRADPEPPGYPLVVALGRMVNVFVREPFVALVALSVIASVAGAWLVARSAGPAAAILLFLSPALLIFGPIPNGESVAIAAIAAAFFFHARQQPDLFAVVAAAAIGARPQIAPAMIAAFVVTRPRFRGAALFGAALVLCFVPLLEEVSPAWAKESYVTMRMASEAVGAHGKELALRFVAHPWGPKVLSIPLLVLAMAGIVLSFHGAPPNDPQSPRPGAPEKAASRNVPLLLFGVVHLAVAFLFLDRSDGVQPVLPALLPIAVFAGRVPWSLPVALIYAAGSIVYSYPLLEARRAPSPPMQAVASVPAAAVVLYEPSLEPHVRGLNAHPIRDFGAFEDVIVIADGGSSTPGAQTFSWPDSDAYGKITTDRYRVVSLIPFPPQRRYLARAGVFSFERTAGGEEWRWLARDAVIDLPTPGSTVTLRFGLPPEAETTRVTVNGKTVAVESGGTAALTVPYAPRLTIRSNRSVQRGARDLAVQLLSLEIR